MKQLASRPRMGFALLRRRGLRCSGTSGIVAAQSFRRCFVIRSSAWGSWLTNWKDRMYHEGLKNADHYGSGSGM